MKNNSSFFSKNLQYLRKEKRITQAELATRIGVDQTTIGRWEDGNREPTIGNVSNIADYFNVSIPDLLDKDLSKENVIKNTNVLFDKYKDILTESDINIINAIVEARKKEIDKELREDE